MRRRFAIANAAAVFDYSLGVESSINPEASGSVEDLISPHWAGISTLAHGPGCCGVVGPVPSATLDKRCQLQQQGKNSKTYFGVKGYEMGPSKEAQITGATAGFRGPRTNFDSA